MPDKHQSPKCSDCPPAPGHLVNMFSPEELVEELDKLWRDKRLLNRLNRASARIWRATDPDELVTEAIMKLLKARPGSISKDIPLYRTIIRNMKWIALDYLKSPDTLGAAGRGGRTPFESLGSLAATGQGPGDRLLYEQLLSRLLERARKIEQKQHAEGRDKVLPLHDYLKLRFEEGLEGEELRSALGLSPKDFATLTKAARRLVMKFLEEGRA